MNLSQACTPYIVRRTLYGVYCTPTERRKANVIYIYIYIYIYRDIFADRGPSVYFQYISNVGGPF